MPTGSVGSDRYHREWLERLGRSNPEAFRKAMTKEFNRRLVGLDPHGEPPWQGTSWVLDLLPRWPMHAIEVLEAYLGSVKEQCRRSGLGFVELWVRDR